MFYKYILFEYIYKIKKKKTNSEFVTSDCWLLTVSGGAVQLRDLTLDEPYSKHSKLAKRDKSQYFKTMQCWFYGNHPDGCPRTAQNCHFAHGEQDVRKEQSDACTQ